MEDLYEIAFGLILHAGNSRSASITAVQKAEKENFEEAEELLKTADSELKMAHDVQTKMLQAEANGSKNEINLIMVHAQDHLAMALSQREVSSQFIRLYKKLEECKNA